MTLLCIHNNRPSEYRWGLFGKWLSWEPKLTGRSYYSQGRTEATLGWYDTCR